MKKIIFLSLFLSSLFAHVATLIEKDGIVKDKHKDSIKKVSLKVNDKIEKGDTIYTYNSIAVIRLNDNSIIKLSPNSELKFDENKVSQKRGEIYFNIQKRKLHKLKIATNFTTIGVKGTIFIVNSKKTNSVALKKGLLSFKSLNGKYEIHRKKLMNEFEQFKKQQQDEFENYKKQLYKEFIEYKKSFSLKENKVVSFNGNKVYENSMNKNNLNEFNKFENSFRISEFHIKNNKNKNSIENIEKKKEIQNNKIDENNDNIGKELDNLEKDMKKLQNDYFNELDEE